MSETDLKIVLMRYERVLTTHNPVVKAEGDLKDAVHNAFARFRREHPDDQFGDQYVRKSDKLAHYPTSIGTASLGSWQE